MPLDKTSGMALPGSSLNVTKPGRENAKRKPGNSAAISAFTAFSAPAWQVEK